MSIPSVSNDSNRVLAWVDINSRTNISDHNKINGKSGRIEDKNISSSPCARLTLGVPIVSMKKRAGNAIASETAYSRLGEKGVKDIEATAKCR